MRPAGPAGGLRPGGFDVTKADVYEDGLVIPPMLLFDGGKPVRSLFALLMANTRFSELIAPDIHSIQAALELGEGDDQRAGVDRREQHPQARAGEHPPLVVGRVTTCPEEIHLYVNVSLAEARGFLPTGLQ